jgi:hypothetical protein
MVPRPPLEAPLTWSSISVTARCDTVPETAVLSAAQVCAALGVSAANQRVPLHRARAVMRAALIGYHGS